MIDRFPQRTLEWLSLPVLADPFWGRSPWLQAPRRKTQQAEEVQQDLRREVYREVLRTPGVVPGCAWVRWDADFHDILTEADVCTRLSAPAASSTGWRPET